MYTAISPCKYATLFRMRMHSLHPLARSSCSSFFFPLSLLFPSLLPHLSLPLLDVPLRTARGKVFDRIPVLLGKFQQCRSGLDVPLLPNWISFRLLWPLANYEISAGNAIISRLKFEKSLKLPPISEHPIRSFRCAFISKHLKIVIFVQEEALRLT